MATYRVARILESKGKFTEEEIRLMNEQEAWQRIREDASGLSDTSDIRESNGVGEMGRGQRQGFLYREN
jgi:hypothetical protein